MESRESWGEHVAKLRAENAVNPEPIVDGPKIRKPRAGPADMDPINGGTVLRKHQGKLIPTPIASQTQFDEQGELRETVQQAANYRGVLKELTPIEKQAQDAARGRINPANDAKAQRMRRAIATNSKPK